MRLKENNTKQRIAITLYETDIDGIKTKLDEISSLPPSQFDKFMEQFGSTALYSQLKHFKKAVEGKEGEFVIELTENKVLLYNHIIRELRNTIEDETNKS